MQLSNSVLALALVSSVACDRGGSRETPTRTVPATVLADAPPTDATTATSPSEHRAAGATPTSGTCKLAPFVHKRPMPKRLVAIGDLHGDLAGTRAALRTAGAIDTNDKWIGGAMVIVQTGDVLDRGDDEQAIIDLLQKLGVDARAAGGDLIALLGNHELMNAAGDFRYVTPGAMTDFDDVPGLDTAKWAKVPEAARKRFTALAPGGIYAKKLAQYGAIAIVGDTIFSHAGVLGDWVTQIETVNETSRCWLDGQAGGPTQPPSAVTSEDGPLWTRAVGFPEADCVAAQAALKALNLKRMVVGHTVQKHINGACDNTVWRIDVGLAKLYDGPIEVLEIFADAPPKVLVGKRL